MIAKDRLELELRRLRRLPVRDDLRDRVLTAAAACPERESRGGPAGIPWSFAAIAAALAIVVALGVWTVRPEPPAVEAVPPVVAPAARQTQITRAPGDDVVVFWLDDETPVFVSLNEAR